MFPTGNHTVVETGGYTFVSYDQFVRKHFCSNDCVPGLSRNACPVILFLNEKESSTFVLLN